MKFPTSLLYSDLHTWARSENDATVTIGITDYAQYELGELQYIGLPRVGSSVLCEKSFGEAESVKTASELLSPVSGTVVAVNMALIADPQIVNQDPYDAGWMVRLALNSSSDLGKLIDCAAYRALIGAPEGDEL